MKRRGRGEGSVYQRGDGTWTASISLGAGVDGKRRRRTLYAPTKNELLEKLRKMQHSADRGQLPDVVSLTVGEMLAAWLEAIKPAVANGTHASYSQHVRNLIKPKLGGVRLAKLGSLHVQSLYKLLAEDEYSTAMQRHAGVTLRAALSWAVHPMGLIPDNPAKRVKMPAHTKREVRGLEPEQVAAFFEAAKGERLYALYPLAIDSGCRQGELLGLMWHDVDFDRGTVAVSRSLEEVGGSLALKEPKTAKSRRTIALSAFTLDALGEHRKRMLAEGSYRPDAPIFCGVRNRSWLRKSDIYRHSFAPILKQAGLKFNFHSLRHACASFLLMAGTDVKTVQERMGHSSAMMTLNTYGHVLAGAQGAAALKLHAILTSADQAGAAKTG